jgi:hypothetical protein
VDLSGLDCENDTDAIEKARLIAIGVSLDKPAVDPERHIAVLNADRTKYSKCLFILSQRKAFYPGNFTSPVRLTSLRGAQRSGYLPFVSTFCFSSSFIFLIVGSWLLSPVVCVVVAGGLVFGTEVCAGGVVAGRVAVVAGGGLVWAGTSATFQTRTLATKAASVVTFVSILLSFICIHLALL